MSSTSPRMSDGSTSRLKIPPMTLLIASSAKTKGTLTMMKMPCVILSKTKRMGEKTKERKLCWRKPKRRPTTRIPATAPPIAFGQIRNRDDAAVSGTRCPMFSPARPAPKKTNIIVKMFSGSSTKMSMTADTPMKSSPNRKLVVRLFSGYGTIMMRIPRNHIPIAINPPAVPRKAWPSGR